MKNEYRIVADKFLGFEVQVRFWWLPIFWIQCWDHGPTNTHHSADDAEAFAREHAEGLEGFENKAFEKYLGRLPSDWRHGA